MIQTDFMASNLRSTSPADPQASLWPRTLNDEVRDRRSCSRPIDFEYICEVARRFLRQLDRDPVRVPRPLKVGFRPEQSYSGDVARVIRRIRTQGFDR